MRDEATEKEEVTIIAKYLFECCKKIKDIEIRYIVYGFVFSWKLLQLKHKTGVEFGIFITPIQNNRLSIIVYNDDKTIQKSTALSLSTDPTEDIERFINSMLELEGYG